MLSSIGDFATGKVTGLETFLNVWGNKSVVWSFDNVGLSCFLRQAFTDISIYVFFTAVSFLVHKINVNIDPFEKQEDKI